MSQAKHLDFEFIPETHPHEVRISFDSGAFITAKNKYNGKSIACIVRCHTVDKNSLQLFFANNKILSESYDDFKIVGEMRWITVIGSILRGAQKRISKEIPRSDSFDVIFLAEQSRVFVEKSLTPTVIASEKKIRVIIVDDSKTIRNLLRNMFATDSQFEVIADCELPSIAEKKIIELKPDVVTLDLHMPEMDGVELLKRVFKQQPTRFVVVSAVTIEEGPLVFNALEEGAIDYAQKPSFENFSEHCAGILEKVRLASAANIVTRKNSVRSAPATGQMRNDGLIVIGSSTGGTEALKQVLTCLPASIPPILIVQHIPAMFSKAFADRLNTLCTFEVLEATDGMLVKENRVIVAAGGFQMKLEKSGKNFVVRVEDAAPVNRHKPSVDFLFNSVAAFGIPHTVGIILTGMGADGAKGLLKLKQNGCFTIAQDEETSVVYGMPKEAFKLGAAQKVVPLQAIAAEIMNHFSMRKVS